MKGVGGVTVANPEPQGLERSLISSEAHSCRPTRPVPLLQTPRRRPALHATHDATAQEESEKTDAYDESVKAHLAPHTPAPCFDGVRIGADAVAPLIISPSQVRRTADKQLAVIGASPSCPSFLRKRDTSTAWYPSGYLPPPPKSPRHCTRGSSLPSPVSPSLLLKLLYPA